MKRYGEKFPSFSNVDFNSETKGNKANILYRKTGRKLNPWQLIQLKGICAVDKKGLWKYQKYAIAVSRRNGKGEILVARELFGIVELGEKICHTAHRTTTSHDAFLRLYAALKNAGFEEYSRKKKEMPEKSFFASKQFGLEHIEIKGGGTIDFRTRSDNGGLGEGFDLLVIDEAQEYTEKQESALIYTTSASKNPQIIYTGTPPTTASHGDKFVKLRNSVLQKKAHSVGWNEWSISELPKNPMDVDLWYKFNPSLGYTLAERNIYNELSTEFLDFCIQRLGYWVSYNQKSEFSEAEWKSLEVAQLPVLSNERFLGIKYGRNGQNVAVSVCSRTKDGKFFVEGIDCVSVRSGNGWILKLCQNPKIRKVVIDGQSGQQNLLDDLRANGNNVEVIFPTVAEIISANSFFEKSVYGKKISHRDQKSMSNIISNCKKRLIGSRGGFGYESLVENYDIALMDSAILAIWICSATREKKAKQKIQC